MAVPTAPVRWGCDNCGGNGPLAAGRYQSRLELQLMRPPDSTALLLKCLCENSFLFGGTLSIHLQSASVVKVSLNSEICLQQKLHHHHAKSRELMHTSETWWLERPGLPGCIHLRVAL